MFLKQQFDSTVHDSWIPLLENEFSKDYMINMSDKLQKMYDVYNIYPKKQNIFKALSLPIDEIKAVFLGQDPFPNTGIANGYAFSCNDPKVTPESLKLIFKELAMEYNVKTLSGLVKRPVNLQDWVDQGVMLLNTILTVKKNSPNSHKGLGWEIFTTEVLKIVASQDRPIVYALWGKQAQALGQVVIKNPKHIILEAAHPAAEKHGRVKFTGCNHFKEINSILENNNLQTIKWF